MLGASHETHPLLKHALGQAADVRLKLELLDERRFGNGVVLLRYATRT